MSGPGEAEVFLVREAGPTTLAIEKLRRDPDLVCRARGVNARTVNEYAEAMRAGVTFPPVIVFRDAKGVHWLADGFHRTSAAEVAGLADVSIDLREGGRREALLYAANANATHGLRRTNADKRRAVTLVLAACPKLSDRKVGEACGVDNKTVAAVRNGGRLKGEEIPHSDRAKTSESDTPNAALARLSRAIEKLVGCWPASRHTDLRLLLARLMPDESKSRAIEAVS